MNISKFCKKAPAGVLLHTASLGRDYKVLQGNEYFYELISNEKDIPFIEFVHPEDRASFDDAIEKLPEGEQHIVVKIKAHNANYRYYLVKFTYNNRIIDDFKSYDISIMDIYTVESRAFELEYNAKKYRRYMGMMAQYYFEYDPKSNLFKIFTYMNDKNNMLLKQDLDEFQADMKAHYMHDKKSEMALDILVAYLKDGAEEFEIQISSTLLSKAGRVDNLVFKGSTFYYYHEKVVTGIMLSKSRLQIERAYYLTEAAKDSATGLYNKRATMEYAMDRFKRSADSNIALIIIDIDNFKTINDTYGHLFGDEIIVKVSDIIKGTIHSRGVAGRFGGDEFMIILEQNVDDEHISTLLNSIEDQLHWEYQGINDNIKLTASIGVAKYPTDGSNYEEIFTKADKALYVAKAKGKDNFVIYNEASHKDIIIHENAGARHTLSADWSQTISSCILDLHCNGTAAIPGVLKNVTDLTEINSIRIFVGDDMKKTFTTGNYPVDTISLYDNVDNNYFDIFSDNGSLIVTNTENYEENRVFFEEYNRQDIKAFMQFISYRNNKPYVLISFDVFEHGYQWSKEERDSLMVLSKLIGQIIIENQGI